MVQTLGYERMSKFSSSGFYRFQCSCVVQSACDGDVTLVREQIMEGHFTRRSAQLVVRTFQARLESAILYSCHLRR